jgi:BlaI family transcriptional regulator, penicillinase repressor
MLRTHIKVTDSELTILEILWRGGDFTVRDLANELYPDGGVSGYATVQILLQRLEKKKCIKRDSRQRVHVYRASAQREQIIVSHLQHLADRLLGGRLTPLVTHLVRMGKFSAEDRRALRELLEETKENPDKP